MENLTSPFVHILCLVCTVREYDRVADLNLLLVVSLNLRGLYDRDSLIDLHLTIALTMTKTMRTTTTTTFIH